MSSSITRRAGLGAAAAIALTSCGGGDPAPRSGPGPGSGAGLLNSILAFERAVVAAYEAIAELLNGDALRYARQIQTRERDHVRRLEELLHGLGATPAPGRTQAEYARSFPVMDSPDAALHFAEDVEERLVRNYLEALAKLPEVDLRRPMAEIAADEGGHLAVIHVLRNEPAAPTAFVTGTL
jgi:rubrerythrin